MARYIKSTHRPARVKARSLIKASTSRELSRTVDPETHHLPRRLGRGLGSVKGSKLYKTASELNKSLSVLSKLDKLLAESVLEKVDHSEAEKLINILQELIVTISSLSSKSQEIYNKSIEMLNNLQENLNVLQVQVENKLSSESINSVLKSSFSYHDLDKNIILDLIQ